MKRFLVGKDIPASGQVAIWALIVFTLIYLSRAVLIWVF